MFEPYLSILTEFHLYKVSPPLHRNNPVGVRRFLRGVEMGHDTWLWPPVIACALKNDFLSNHTSSHRETVPLG